MVVFQKLKLKWTNGNHFRRGTFFQLFFLPPLFLARKTFTSFPHPCFSSTMAEISISENCFFFFKLKTPQNPLHITSYWWRSLHSSCLQQDEVRNINNWKYYILVMGMDIKNEVKLSLYNGWFINVCARLNLNGYVNNCWVMKDKKVGTKVELWPLNPGARKTCSRAQSLTHSLNQAIMPILLWIQIAHITILNMMNKSIHMQRSTIWTSNSHLLWLQ